MATVVCQGLQSCLESQLLEPTTLRLILSSSPSSKPLFSDSLELALKPNYSSTESSESTRRNSDNGGWSFLQDLSNSSPVDKETLYVHPLANRYSSKLSQKSLELCTESLGCETGSDISSESSFLFNSSISSESESEEEVEIVRKSNSNSNSENQNRNQHKKEMKAVNRSFPPPLTTMSGPESLQFRPRRESGRLIITAVKSPGSRPCFQAERVDGRLRLSLVKDSASNFDSEENDENDVDREEKEEDAENDVVFEEDEEMEEGNWIEEEEKDAEGNNLKVGGEIENEDFAIRTRRNRRCKDGEIEKNGLLNWEPFWVAT